MLNVTKDVLQHFTSDLGPLSSAAIGLASLVVACWSARSAWLRWLTFRAHSPLPLVTRLLSGFVQAYSYDEDGFYGADGAPLEVQERRRRHFAIAAQSGEPALSCRGLPQLPHVHRHRLEEGKTVVQQSAGVPDRSSFVRARASFELPFELGSRDRPEPRQGDWLPER